MPTKARSSEGNRLRRVSVAVANPAIFGEIYLRPFDPNWNGPLPEVAKDELRFAMGTQRGVLIMPPEFLKTTMLSQLYPLWLTARYAAAGALDRLSIMLLSEEEGLASANLRVVEWHIENNPLIARDFVDAEGRRLLVPDPDEDKWTDTEFVVVRRGASKDPTAQAKGLESMGIQGSRIRHLIGDDVITPRSAGSPAKRKRALELWDLSITTRVFEDGQAIIAGNFNSSRDLLSTLAARPSYSVFKRPSLHVKGKPEQPPADPTDPKAELTLPERWSRERLDRERADKPNRFRRIHLLDPHAAGGERLKVEWMTVIPADETPMDKCKFYFGLDIAVGGDSADLDFFNLTVGAAHGDHLDIVACHDTRAEIAEQVELLAVYYDRFSRLGRGVAAIGGAKVAIDRLWRKALKMHRSDLDPKLVEVSIPGSKEERLEGLGPPAKSGYLRVWEQAWTGLTADAEDQPAELSLSEQWTDFPEIPHDDKLDGVDVLVRTASEFAGRAAEPKTVKI